MKSLTKLIYENKLQISKRKIDEHIIIWDYFVITAKIFT
jgi:hypothetical protein